jgi:hypothetical protein
MKIKTVLFWILWLGNDFTLQTVGEQNPDPASLPSFPQNSTADYADNTDTGSGGFNWFGISKSGTLIVLPVLSAEQRTRLDALQNVVDATHNNFDMVRPGINFAF